MKRKFSLSIVLVLLSLSACTRKLEDTETLVLGTNASYPPYESVAADGEIIGFDIDVAKAVAEKLGKRLVIKNMSFDALILALKQSKSDFIMAGISITPSREKEIAMVPYQGKQTKALTLLFWNKAPDGVKEVKDLQNVGNKTVAVGIGSYMENYLSKFPQIQAKALEDVTELVMDVKYGKSVAALVEPHIANTIVPKHPQLKRIDFDLPKEEWVLGNGIGLRKDNAKLIGEIQEAISQLKQDGTIQKLEEKWMNG